MHVLLCVMFGVWICAMAIIKYMAMCMAMAMAMCKTMAISIILWLWLCLTVCNDEVLLTYI